MTLSADSADRFIIRPLVEADVPAWLKLVHAVELDSAGKTQTTEEQLRRVLGWARARRWVIEAPGEPETLIGYGFLYAQIKERGYNELMIHPAWRRQGLGRRLSEHLCEAARSAGVDWVNIEIDDRNTGGIAFLEAVGFAHHSYAWVLRAPAEAAFPQPVWPQGYSARSYAEVNDLSLFTRAINRGYGDQWGHSENTAGGVTEDDAQGYLKNFDPNGVFIVFAPDGSPVGACRVEVGDADAAEDVLDGPGIAPEHRALNLHIPLALHALAYLRSKGRRPVRLESWGDSPETIAQYAALGFTIAERNFAYRKNVR